MRTGICYALSSLLLLAVYPGCSDAGAQSTYLSERMPYAAFDRLPQTLVTLDTAVLDVRFAPGEFELPRQKINDWLIASARAVSIYYGTFPVPKPRILIVPVSGRGVQGGQAFGYRGPAIRLMLGTASSQADLKADWKAVHEMVHLALPDVSEEHLWLAEGLAVYVESIARVQAGDLTEQKIWGDFLRDMPKGQPGAGDRGLEFTHTWGRTYWGGAIFCLVADVEYRRRTNNRIGLRQAMQGVLAQGGTHDRSWSIERILKTADAVTGTDVLVSLYGKMGSTPYAADLDALWTQLGIFRDATGLTLSDTAPLSQIRKAIVSASP